MNQNQTTAVLFRFRPRFALQAVFSLLVALHGFKAVASDDLEIAIMEIFSGQSSEAQQAVTPPAPAATSTVPMPIQRPRLALATAESAPVTCSNKSAAARVQPPSNMITLKELVAQINEQKAQMEHPAPSRRIAEALVGAPQRHYAAPRSESRPRTNKVLSPLPSYTRSMIAKKNPPRCRRHPVSKRMKTHAGCDLGAKSGTTIVSVLDGTVVDSGSRGGYGNMVTVRHKLPNGKVVYSKYAHMRTGKGCKMPKAGTKVSAGQKIGCVGSTGVSTGPHLHFEIRSAAKGGHIYDSKHFLLHNGELKSAKTCGQR